MKIWKSPPSIFGKSEIGEILYFFKAKCYLHLSAQICVPKKRKPSISKRTGGFGLFSDSLPSAGIIQQVRGVVPIIRFGISQPVQLPQQIYLLFYALRGKCKENSSRARIQGLKPLTLSRYHTLRFLEERFFDFFSDLLITL